MTTKSNDKIIRVKRLNQRHKINHFNSLMKEDDKICDGSNRL